MTSQDSWIDQDEINQLVNSIEGKKETPAPAPEAESPLLEENAPIEDGAPVSLDQQPEDGVPIEDEAPASLDLQPEDEAPIEDEAPVSIDKASDSTDENETGGYIFSLGDDDEIASEPGSEEATSQESMRQPQVVQALAEVRNRANRGGLLKSSFQKGPSPLWPEFPPLDDENPAPEPAAEASADETEPVDEETPEKSDRRPKALRKRLEEFADSTVTKFDATGFSITDFSGYQLLQRGDEDTLALSAATSLVTDQINQLSEAVGAPELGSTQISLSDDRWLCLVEAQSSAGGILAQLQLPEPMTSSATTSFRRDLEAVLAS